MEISKFDKRIIARNLKNGTITKKEYASHLKRLEDASAETETISIPLYPWEVKEENEGQADDETASEDGPVEEDAQPEMN